MLTLAPRTFLGKLTPKQFEQLLKQRSDCLAMIAGLLIACDVSIQKFPRKKYQFPPSKAETLRLLRDFIEVKGEKKKEKELTSEKELKEKLRQNGLLATEDTKGLPLDDDLLDYQVIVKKKLDRIKIQDSESFNEILECCALLYGLYGYLLEQIHLHSRSRRLTGHHNTEIVIVGYVLMTGIISKGYELIGYWTAKMEEKVRNRGSALTKSKERLGNKEIIRKMLAEHNGEIDTEFLAKGMMRIDRGERTLKDLIKEIREEESE